MGLTEYREKRNFAKTAEPSGREAERASKADPLFVVQKHAASRLHYDFRLHMEGVLKSWAVPKGFPVKNGERRLAVQVEDHPVDYAGFEGTIPPGNYGAGTVMVWDQGTYSAFGHDPVQSLKNGKLHLVLAGKKLKGEWTLVRLRHPREGDQDQWLLMKTGGDAPPISARADDRSVLTKRSPKQIATDNDAQWHSDRPATRSPAARKEPRKSTPSPRSNHPALKKLPAAKPGFSEPMKALLVDQLPTGPEWIYEVKFDGFRALAVKDGKKVALYSRNAKALTDRYPEVVRALETLPVKQAVLDGEIVAVDREGRSSFQLLQSYLNPGPKKPPLFYYAFDILNLEGKSVAGLPLTHRKELLQSILEHQSDPLRFSASIQAESTRVADEMKQHGLEGLIAKRRHCKYESGKRTGAWAKFKWSLEQEFVIGGYTPPKGARGSFGAILVGYYEQGKLLFASKVGAGFNAKLLASLHACFQKFVRKTCPFANLPERLRSGLGAAEMKTCTWLKPELVCQVRFTEWTRDHHLRHPLFLGLREDKQASEVRRERPASPPDS